MRIVLIKKPDVSNENDTCYIQMKQEVTTLEQALEMFEDFLKGCGFCFDGSLEIYKEDVVEVLEERNSHELD